MYCIQYLDVTVTSERREQNHVLTTQSPQSHWLAGVNYEGSTDSFINSYIMNFIIFYFIKLPKKNSREIDFINRKTISRKALFYSQDRNMHKSTLGDEPEKMFQLID